MNLVIRDGLKYFHYCTCPTQSQINDKTRNLNSPFPTHPPAHVDTAVKIPVCGGGVDTLSALGLTSFFLLFLSSDIRNLVLMVLVILDAVVFGIGFFLAR